ncbi:MAG: hypothetical protein JWN40_1573 [Phycisphaerales bacterium]|nr:hypothetical protein [Phycisphaerales bacterium]
MDDQEARKRLEEHFGSRLGMLGVQVTVLAQTAQPCDVTFYKKKPALNVKINPRINLALMYGAGAQKLGEMLEAIELSNGDVVSLTEIWTILPLPVEGFTDEELAAVNLDAGEEKVGPQGETLRKMISETYHCETREEEDYLLRRYIAS